MQRIINALVLYKNLILYLTLLSAAIFFLNNRSYYHQSQFGKIGLSLSVRVHKIRESVSRYFSLASQNELLLEENRRLKKAQLIDYKKSISIDKYCALPIELPFEVKRARVVKNSFNLARNYLLLDKGSNDGIAPEMGVLSATGIVGIVEQVTEKYARVMSILHSDASVNARFKNSAAYGPLRWSGKKPFQMQLEDIVTTAKVSVRDTVVTGMSAYFPSGYPVGVVSNLIKPVTQGYYEITIDLFNNLTELDFVYIVENKDLLEISHLTKNDEE